jgi:hypothetical protein
MQVELSGPTALDGKIVDIQDGTRAFGIPRLIPRLIPGTCRLDIDDYRIEAKPDGHLIARLQHTT